MTNNCSSQAISIVTLYQWWNNNGKLKMTSPTVVHQESFPLLLYINRETTTVR